MVTRRAFLTHFAATGRARDAAPHTLVCVFLRGGADTLNVVVPHGDDDYYRARPSIAIPRPGATGGAIRLDDYYGFHPAMRPLGAAYAEGRLAVVQAAGTDNTSGSHFEAQDQMEHGAGAGDATSGGWIGRYLRAGARESMSPLAAVAIGTTLPESLHGAATAAVLLSLDEVGLRAPRATLDRATRALASLYGPGAGLLERPGTEALRLLGRVEAIKASPYVPANGAAYPDDSFAAGLREVARLVKADVGLEVACLDLDGWDTHFVQGAADGLQAGLIARFAGGLAAFDADVAEFRDRVTVVAMTEFGRRIYENSSSGTDHGRGAAMFVLGGRARGGAIHGEWPGLDREEGPIGPGGLRVLVDYRSVLAEILTTACGLRDTRKVFPGFAPATVGVVV
jgi:uncharacterized protein (DUF1501 family)